MILLPLILQEGLTPELEKALVYHFHACSYDDLYEIVVGLRVIAEDIMKVNERSILL